MIKKLLLTSALVVGMASSVSAAYADKSQMRDTSSMKFDGLTVTLGGSIDEQLGFNTDQKNAFKYSTPYESGTFGNFGFAPSPATFATTKSYGKLNEFNFANSTKFWIKADGQNEAYGFRYGGMLKMFADTSDAKEQMNRYMFDPTYQRARVDVTSGPPTTYNFANDTNGDPAWKKIDDRGLAMQTMMYVEGVFGRVEFGSTTGASHAMQVDARTFARASGADDARRWWNQWTYRGNMPTSYAYLEAPTMPTNSESRYGIRTVNANKITYYTPEYMGFMLGVSYIPDTDVNGTIGKAGGVTKTMSTINTAATTNDNGPVTGNFAVPYRNVFEGGIHYQGMFNDFGIKAALLGQTGEAKKTLFTFGHTGSAPAFAVASGASLKNNKNLSAWEAGLNLSYMGWTVGGSYGAHGKSGYFNRFMWNGVDLSEPNNNAANAGVSRPKKTTYWTAGLGFEQGPVGASLVYFESKQGVPGVGGFIGTGAAGAVANATDGVQTANGQAGYNKLEQFTFAVDYKLAPGLMPYLEVSAFRMKDKHYEIGTAFSAQRTNAGGGVNDVYGRKDWIANRGVIVLVGSKLEF